MGISAVAISCAVNVSVPYFCLGKTFKRLVICFSVDYIPSVDVVESLTREHYRQQFLLDLNIVFFGVCHGSACVTYQLDSEWCVERRGVGLIPRLIIYVYDSEYTCTNEQEQEVYFVTPK